MTLWSPVAVPISIAPATESSSKLLGACFLRFRTRQSIQNAAWVGAEPRAKILAILEEAQMGALEAKIRRLCCRLK